LHRGGTWGLTIVGSGPLKNKLDFSNVDYVGFKNPEEVAAIMNDSSCLILVSKVEHWGTVAVEAMACGLPLIISRNVGSFDDLYCNNGVNLDRPSQNLISDAMAQMETLSVDQLSRMSELSIERSTKFNSFSYSNLIEKIIDSRGIH
jgi:glycosyltransferase involved in cell wall biosynthesis